MKLLIFIFNLVRNSWSIAAWRHKFFPLFLLSPPRSFNYTIIILFMKSWSATERWRKVVVWRCFTLLFIFNSSREFFLSPFAFIVVFLFLRIFVVEFSLNSDLLPSQLIYAAWSESEDKRLREEIFGGMKNPWCMLVFRQFHNLAIIFRAFARLKWKITVEKKQKSRTFSIDAYRRLSCRFHISFADLHRPSSPCVLQSRLRKMQAAEAECCKAL